MFLGAQTFETLILCLALMWKIPWIINWSVVGTTVRVLRPIWNVEESNVDSYVKNILLKLASLLPHSASLHGRIAYAEN